MQYAYPCDLEPDEDGFMVTFPDIPGALTWGADIGEALENAQEVLELALGWYIEEWKELPNSSPPNDDQEIVMVHPPFAAKLALHAAILQCEVALSELADRLGVSETDVQEMLDPYVHTPISQLIAALQVIGRRVVLEDWPADGGLHFCYPAARKGSLDMSLREFIRRVRRYSLAYDLRWLIEGPDLDSESDPTLLRVGDRAVILPEEDDLESGAVELLLNELAIDTRQF